MKSPRLLIPIPFLLLTAPALPAQEVLNWHDFELCNDCELEVTELVRLGDADGPGEFRSIGDVDVIDGRIAVLDRAKSAVVILSPAGEYITQHRYRLDDVAPFTPVGQGRIVIPSTNWRTRVIEHPLHLMDLSSGAPTLHFGAANAGAEVTGLQWNFGKRVAESVMSRPSTMWWGWIATPAVQEWSVEGELLRDFDGDLPWFPEIHEAPDRAREPPETLLNGLALDGDDNLWMMISTADPEWDEVPMLLGRVGPYPAPDTDDDYFDSRLDIFSLGERRHLGMHVWDSRGAKLLDHGRYPAVYDLEYSDAMVPQIVVYGVGAGGR